LYAVSLCPTQELFAWLGNTGDRTAPPYEVLTYFYPEAVREAKRLRRASPKTGERRSFRIIAVTLAKGGHLTKTGKPLTATAIKRMVEGPMPAGK
jgi:hypothetical protein